MAGRTIRVENNIKLIQRTRRMPILAVPLCAEKARLPKLIRLVRAL
jgi:hypothetical protein